MDSWGLEALLLAFLQSQWTFDNVLADIIFLVLEIEEFANVASTLWSKTTWNVDVSDSFDFLFSFTDDNQSEGRQVLINNATAN